MVSFLSFCLLFSLWHHGGSGQLPTDKSDLYWKAHRHIAPPWLKESQAEAFCKAIAILPWNERSSLLSPISNPEPASSGIPASNLRSVLVVVIIVVYGCFLLSCYLKAFSEPGTVVKSFTHFVWSLPTIPCGKCPINTGKLSLRKPGNLLSVVVYKMWEMWLELRLIPSKPIPLVSDSFPWCLPEASNVKCPEPSSTSHPRFPTMCLTQAPGPPPSWLCNSGGISLGLFPLPYCPSALKRPPFTISAFHHPFSSSPAPHCGIVQAPHFISPKGQSLPASFLAFIILLYPNE